MGPGDKSKIQKQQTSQNWFRLYISDIYGDLFKKINLPGLQIQMQYIHSVETSFTKPAP
jgi:hypothetical protein